MAVLTKEDHSRNHRRRARQLFGAVLLLFVLIGISTVLRFGAGIVSQLLDDTELRAEYAKKLEGFVLFDPLPFEGIENMDDVTLRSAAVWGTVYSVLDTSTGLDAYERDPTTDQVMLPSIEVDAYLAKVLDPSFKLQHQTFEMDDMTITYDEAKQCYLIPVTSSVGYYTPTVPKLFKQGGKLYVTVGYIPINNNSDLLSSAATEPTKYMDYVFERSKGNWYLTGVEESATKASATVASGADSELASSGEISIEEAILAGLDSSSVPPEEEAGSEAGADSGEDSAEADAQTDSDEAASSSDAA